MEWLKDKKNLPIIAGLGVVVLLLAIAAILFETGIIGGTSQDVATTAPSPPAPMAPPSDPHANQSDPHAGPPSGSLTPGAAASVPGAPGKPGVPGAQAAKPGVKVPTNVAKGPDPFNVPGQKISNGATPKPVKPAISSFVEPVYIASVAAPGIPSSPNTPGPNGTPPPPLSIPDIRLTTQESQTMRVSGVVLTNGNGIRAVLEANGQSLTVQPGDAVPGGRVISIQADGLTMKADDGSLIHVPIGNGNPQGG